jgi:hypothetical protein
MSRSTHVGGLVVLMVDGPALVLLPAQVLVLLLMPAPVLVLEVSVSHTALMLLLRLLLLLPSPDRRFAKLRAGVAQLSFGRLPIRVGAHRDGGP